MGDAMGTDRDCEEQANERNNRNKKMLNLRLIINISSSLSTVASLRQIRRLHPSTVYWQAVKNEQIKQNTIKLIGIDGKSLGESTLQNALALRANFIKQGKQIDLLQVKAARDDTLAICRLVELLPQADRPAPAVKLAASSKKVEKPEKVDAKKAKDNTKKPKVKELGISNQTGDNDLQYKVKQAAGWLAKGNDVKINVMTRAAAGSKWSDPQTSFKKFEDVVELLSKLSPEDKCVSVVKKPAMEGAIASGMVRLVAIVAG